MLLFDIVSCVRSLQLQRLQPVEVWARVGFRSMVAYLVLVDLLGQSLQRFVWIVFISYWLGWLFIVEPFYFRMIWGDLWDNRMLGDGLWLSTGKSLNLLVSPMPKNYSPTGSSLHVSLASLCIKFSLYRPYFPNTPPGVPCPPTLVCKVPPFFDN